MQECIDSVRLQNWPNIEHFIIDGGSSDDTLDIIARNESWLTGFVSEPDSGAADAINKGFAKCTGDIIAWLNADDYYLPGALEEVVKAYRAEPQASFWFGNGVRADENGKELAAFNGEGMWYDHRALVEGLDYILQPSTFMNAPILRQVNGLDASLRWGFDWDLWIRMANVISPSHIDARLSASREWGETLTATGGFRRAEELRLLAESHSGNPMTPGALCYWLNAMAMHLQASPEAHDDLMSTTMQNFWLAAQGELRKLGVRDNGSPLSPRVLEQETIARKTRPLIIAVDLYPLLPGVSGGIVPWVKGVLRALVKLHPADRVIMFHRPGEPPISIVGANLEYVALDEHPLDFYREMGRHCASIGVDAIIRTYPQELHPHFPLTKQIFVIPDIQHEFYPDFFPKSVLAARRRAFAYALSCGGAVATMTLHSQDTLVNNPWTLTNDVFLMPAALPEELRETPSEGDLPADAASFDQYFYMPANLWPHKNHTRLFEAFRRALPTLPPNTGLVLSGSPEGYTSMIRGFEDLPIIHLGFVPHIAVAALLRNATALVYFSLFEGFGMPLLEAFYHGTPVLCSNTTSLPEVGGDAVLACDPLDVAAMSALMTRIISEEGLRNRLSEKAKKRVVEYDWETPALALRNALIRVSDNPMVPEQRKPLVSVVMPTRNHARFIRDAIDSVLDQNYEKVELIVMDGASTDDTVNILKSYGDRISWVSEPDNGQTDAINKGMLQASGEVLAYLNSDDILLPGAIASAVRYFNDHPECDMVYGNADYIDIDGNITGQYATAEFSLERLMTDCCVCQPAAFWQRRIVDRIGPFDVSLQTTMDYDYWLRMATSGGIIHHTSQKLAQSRLHEDAKTVAMRGKIYEEIFDICERHGGYVSFSYFLGRWSYRMYESWSGGESLRKIAPRLYRIPALAHFLGQIVWIASDRTKSRYIGRVMFQVVDRRSPSLGRLIRKAWMGSSTLRGRLR